MQKKYAVPMALYDIAQFVGAGHERDLGYLQLVKLEIVDGALKWCMESHKAHTIIGNAIAEIQNPLFSAGYWVKPSIPILMHVDKSQVKITMIFKLPGSVSIQVIPGSPKKPA